MTMRNRELSDVELDELFTAGVKEAPVPCSNWMVALTQAALHAQSQRVACKRSFFAELRESLGGWPALAGLTAAGVAGLWIGVNPPMAVSDAVWGETELAQIAPYDLVFNLEEL